MIELRWREYNVAPSVCQQTSAHRYDKKLTLNKTIINSDIYKEKKKCVKNLPRNLGYMQEIKLESMKAGGAETGNFYPMEHRPDQRGSMEQNTVQALEGNDYVQPVIS